MTSLSFLGTRGHVQQRQGKEEEGGEKGKEGGREKTKEGEEREEGAGEGTYEKREREEGRKTIKPPFPLPLTPHSHTLNPFLPFPTPPLPTLP